VGVTERAELFAVMRGAAREVAQLWLARREELGFPLLHHSEETAAAGEHHSAGAPFEGSLPSGPATFVLEIGLEELPAGDVTLAAGQLQAALTALLAKLRLPCGGPVTVGATPRRLVATVPGLVAAQQAREDTVRGPPAKAAQAADGAWTQAAVGFAKKCGVAPGDLFLKEDPSQKGTPSYVWAHVREAGKPAAEVLDGVQRHSCRHHRLHMAHRLAAGGLAAHGEADHVTHALAALGCDARRERSCRDAPRLRHNHAAARFQHELRRLRALAAAGLRLQQHDGVRAQRGKQRGAV
jgi:hypothetical protein